MLLLPRLPLVATGARWDGHAAVNQSISCTARMYVAQF